MKGLKDLKDAAEVFLSPPCPQQGLRRNLDFDKSGVLPHFRGGGGVLMCNMLPEIFRKIFSRFSRFPVLVTQLRMLTPNTSKQGEKDQLPTQLTMLMMLV